MNADLFYEFARGSLIPNMLAFDGHNPKSVVIMDNCSIHHVDYVGQLFHDAGILLQFLPPYSPDINPSVTDVFFLALVSIATRDRLGWG